LQWTSFIFLITLHRVVYQMIMRPTIFKHAAGVSLAFVVSACAVGPDFLPPAAPDVNGYTENALPDKTAAADTAGGVVQSFAADKDIPAEWWKLFSSEPLNALVEQAVKSNPDLQAAEASLRQAQEKLYAGEGVFFPSVSAGAGATREKFSPATFGETNAPSSLFTLYNTSVSVSYGLDLWGGTRRQVEVLGALADVQHFQREAAYITLTSNVVAAAVHEASLKAQVKATQEIIDFEQSQLDVLQDQFKLGAIAKSAVLTQATTLAQQKTALAPLQNQLSQVHTQLAALTGHFPSEKLEEDFDLATLHLPEELPVSLPSDLVKQRPDIKSAEAALHAASAQIGVATAAMLPQITLTGSYGWKSTSFAKLFNPSTNIWSAGSGLVQPIFQGGELLHEKRAAIAAYDKAAAQYKSTVLAAFKNVSDSLRALQFDADALAAQNNATRAASDSLNMAQAQFKAGAISYLLLLDAERAYAQTRIGLVQAQAARFADTAALFQALGGPIPVNAEDVAQDLAKIDADKLCTVDETDLLTSPPPYERRPGEGHNETPEQASPHPNPPPNGEGISDREEKP
jgi:NodT family efflux transporter outer membrane factor (OMF) lipoprotein